LRRNPEDQLAVSPTPARSRAACDPRRPAGDAQATAGRPPNGAHPVVGRPHLTWRMFFDLIYSEEEPSLQFARVVDDHGPSA
jgi:hypothetical protein